MNYYCTFGNQTVKMKMKFLSLVGLLTTIFLLGSCKDELNLIGNFEETPVIYGILDPADSIHYIKVNRTFIGNGSQNAYDLAMNPDSNYFENVECTIREYDGNGALIRTFSLHDTIIENKNQNGVFYAPEQKVYVFYTKSIYSSLTGISTTDLRYPLKTEHNYYIDININDGELEVSTESPIQMIKNVVVTEPPAPGWPLVESTGEYRLYAVNVSVPPTSNAYSLRTDVRFDYKEFTNVAANEFTIKSINWYLGSLDTAPGNTANSFTASGQAFFELLASKIPVDASVESRRAYGMQLSVTCASEELYNYIAVSEPNSSLAQTKPEYTNLVEKSGKRVIGVVASRLTDISYMYQIDPFSSFKRALDKFTTETLCRGPLTGPLGFCSDHNLDSGEIYECP